MVLWLGIIITGVLQINHGTFYTGQEKDKSKRGEYDISLDMYGWKQVMKEFRRLVSDDEPGGIMQKGAPIVSYRWFPAANLDYYVARHTGRFVLAYGPLKSIHKYYWINRDRGGFRQGMDAYFVTTSRDFKDPRELFNGRFKVIDLADVFPVMRGGKVAEYGFIYRLKDWRMPSD